MKPIEETHPSLIGAKDIHTFCTCECSIHKHARKLIQEYTIDKQKVIEAIEKLLPKITVNYDTWKEFQKELGL